MESEWKLPTEGECSLRVEIEFLKLEIRVLRTAIFLMTAIFLLLATADWWW